MSNDEVLNVANETNLNRYPYLQYLVSQMMQNNIINNMPDNYIDYLIVDLEAERISELNMFINSDKTYSLDIAVPVEELGVSVAYKFRITSKLRDIISEVMVVNFGEPEPVKYNLALANKFTVIKGGKA